MVDMKNVLEAINEVVVIPVAVVTFVLLMYIVIYLWTKDPDIIRSKIFLRYREFKNAFLFFALFDFVLILHVSLIYIPHFYSFNDFPLMEDLQRFFGLALILILITFVYYLYKSMK